MSEMIVNGRKLYYQDQGEGYPVLFGHSYLWTSDMWKPQLEALSKHFRCIAVDLWDHGKSGPLGETPYSVARLAEDYWTFMQQLGISEFAVVGLSVGGMWGTEMALRYPENVSGLAIMDSYVGSEPEMTRIKYFGLLDAIEKTKGFSQQMIETVAPLFFSPKSLSEKKELVDRFKVYLSEIKPEHIPGIVALGRAIFTRPNLLDRLPEIKQPTLVITGKDDIPRPPKEAEEMAKRLPNTQLHLIEDAGHISNLEQPDKVTSLIQSFLFSFENVSMN